MNGLNTQGKAHRWAIVSLVLTTPTLLFITANLLKYSAGVGLLYDPIAPIFTNPELRVANAVITGFLLVTPLLAIGISLGPIVRFGVRREQNAFEATIRLHTNIANLLAAAISFLVLAILAGYGLTENILTGR